MEIKIIYDNQSLKGFTSSHGFSCLIDTPDGYLLFDTGWNGLILLENLKKFNIKLKKIKYVFLSHFHWDHIGGLPEILNYAKPVVYALKSFSPNFKNEVKKITELIEVKDRTEIIPGFTSTGELSNKTIAEQSLIITHQNRIILVCGCAHPGLEKIIEKTSAHGEINYLIGGLHDFNNFDLLKNIDNILPCHCTKTLDEIIELYGGKAKIIGAGSIIKVE